MRTAVPAAAIAATFGLFLFSAPGQAQFDLEPPDPAELIGEQLQATLNAAMQGRAAGAGITADIAAARNRVRECGGTCPDKDAVHLEYYRALLAKDLWYAQPVVVEPDPSKLEAAKRLHVMVFGQVDGGIVKACAPLHDTWTGCLRRRFQANWSFAEADLLACSRQYRPLQLCRDRETGFSSATFSGATADGSGDLSWTDGAAGIKLDEQRAEPVTFFHIPGPWEKGGAKAASEALERWGDAGQEYLSCSYMPPNPRSSVDYHVFNYWRDQTPDGLEAVRAAAPADHPLHRLGTEAVSECPATLAEAETLQARQGGRGGHLADQFAY